MQSQMIDVLVIRLRVEYFLFGDRQIRELMAMLLLLCVGRIIRGGLSMTEVYTKCTALFIVRRRTPVRCK